MNSMLKTLLKKQFQSFFYGFGKSKNKAGRNVGTYVGITLFVCLLLGVGLFSTFNQLSKQLLPLSMNWLYFSYVALMALSLAVMGSVFMAISQLYEAKDNDFLLSLPIPSRYILFVRIVPLYVQNFVFMSVVLVPSFIARCINGDVNACLLGFFPIMLFMMPLLALFITCLLGLLISSITVKMRDKTLVTVLFSFVFILIYFVIYFFANSYISTLVEHSDKIGQGIKKFFYPLYSLGKAFEGDIVNFAISVSVILALFALLYLILSKTYIRLITTKQGGAKAKKAKSALKSSSSFGSLFKKEIKRFFGSGIYFLNCGFGSFLMLILLVAFSIKSDWFIGKISQIANMDYIPLLLMLVICFTGGMNCVTAPSISLEGKNIWLLQSLPINLFDVLKAKLLLHYVVTAPIATLTAIVFACILNPSPLMIVAMIILPTLFVTLFGIIGLCYNLKNNNLTWDNETFVLKQSPSVMYTIFTAYGIIAVLIGLFVLTMRAISADIFAIIVACLLVIAIIPLLGWLKKRGTVILQNL